MTEKNRAREEIRKILIAEYRDGRFDAQNPDRVGADIRLDERISQILALSFNGYTIADLIEMAEKKDTGR